MENRGIPWGRPAKHRRCWDGPWWGKAHIEPLKGQRSPRINLLPWLFTPKPPEIGRSIHGRMALAGTLVGATGAALDLGATRVDDRYLKMLSWGV